MDASVLALPAWLRLVGPILALVLFPDRPSVGASLVAARWRPLLFSPLAAPLSGEGLRWRLLRRGGWRSLGRRSAVYHRLRSPTPGAVGDFGRSPPSVGQSVGQDQRNRLLPPTSQGHDPRSAAPRLAPRRWIAIAAFAAAGLMALWTAPTRPRSRPGAPAALSGRQRAPRLGRRRHGDDRRDPGRDGPVPCWSRTVAARLVTNPSSPPFSLPRRRSAAVRRGRRHARSRPARLSARVSRRRT